MSDTILDKLMVAAFALGGLILAAMVLALPIYTIAAYQNDRTWTVTVEGKESIATKDSHEYRVYTDKGNFVVQDALFAGNFHASDTYRELEKGKTYRIETIGFRIPFFSEFPNILEAEVVAR